MTSSIPEPSTESDEPEQLTREKIRQLLNKLQNPSIDIAQFFPAKLPDKADKLDSWQREMKRVQQTLSLLNDPLLQKAPLPQELDKAPLFVLSNAIQALDFTREYTVKLLGATGTGKSTLLNAILGRDILPTGQGTAVTGVPIRIVLCDPQEEPQESLILHFLTRQEFDKILRATEKEKQKEVQTQQVKAPGSTQQKEEQTNPDVASQMIFVAATNWDKNGPVANRQGSKAAMKTLLEKLPKNYASSHQQHRFPIDEDDESLVYYPIVALGARMAMLGLNGITLETRQREEILLYKSVITAVNEKLRQIDEQLPRDFVTQDFKDLPHEAMYKLSGLPELVDDLQVFLTTHRYTVQLEQGRSQIDLALSHIEEICWEYINKHGFSGNDLEDLRRESRERPGRIEADRIKRLQKLYGEMRIAWQQALDAYDNANRLSLPRNNFHKALSDAHQQAVRYMKQRIDNKDFDRFIEVPHNASNGRARPLLIITPDEGSIEVRGNELLTELRSGLAGVLNQLVQARPARELADMFLAPIRPQGINTGGALDINRITFHENGPELDEIRKSYKKLLSDLSNTASQVCRIVTVSDLFDKTHELAKNHELRRKFYDLANREMPDNSQPDKTPEKITEEIFEDGRELMKQMVDVLSRDLVDHVYKRVTFIYRNELEAMITTTTYNIGTAGGPPFKKDPGLFEKLVSNWFFAMTSLLSRSPSLKQKIDGDITRGPEIDTDDWANLIESIQKMRGIL